MDFSAETASDIPRIYVHLLNGFYEILSSYNDNSSETKN